MSVSSSNGARLNHRGTGWYCNLVQDTLQVRCSEPLVMPEGYRLSEGHEVWLRYGHILLRRAWC